MRLLFITLILAITCTGYGQESQIIMDGENLIHLTTYGEGEPMLIINGGPGMSSEGFKKLAAIFGHNYKAIIYDQRGTGKSAMKEVSVKTITLDAMTKDIEIIRRHLGIEQWVILGHSFGGILASNYTATHPGRVKGLILSSSGGVDMDLFSELNITGRLTSTQRDSLSYWNQQITRGDTSYHARLQRGKYLAPAYLYYQKNVPTVAERLTQGNSRINGLVLRNMQRINFDSKPGLKNFSKPVLIIQGKQDIIPEAISEKVHQLFSNSKLVILNHCGHYGWLDQPKKYFRHVNEFLQQFRT